MDKPQFVYVTYIATTLEQLWDALTGEAFTQQYWGGQRIQSDWQVGSPVEPIKDDGDGGNDGDNGDSDWAGEVLESDPPHRLAYTFQSSSQSSSSAAAQPIRVVFDLEPNDSTVKLTVTHENLDVKSFMAISRSLILSDLKSRLEALLAIAV